MNDETRALWPGPPERLPTSDPHATAGFSKMLWADAVRRARDIPVAQRMVILHIGATADRDGHGAWRATDVVAGELGVSRDTVKRARRAGVERGLWLVSKAAPKGAGNTKTAEYQLISPPRNRCSSAPISGVDIGAAAPPYPPQMGATVPPFVETNGGSRSNKWVQRRPEMGAPEGHPSVLTSVLTSGGGGDVESGTSPSDPPPAESPPPRTANSEPKRARCARHAHIVEDHDVPPCRACEAARIAHEGRISNATQRDSDKLAVARRVQIACAHCDDYGRDDDLAWCRHHPTIQQGKIVDPPPVILCGICAADLVRPESRASGLCAECALTQQPKGETSVPTDDDLAEARVKSRGAPVREIETGDDDGSGCDEPPVGDDPSEPR